jgi:deoxyribonuclease V
MEGIDLPAIHHEQRKMAERISLFDGFDRVDTVAGCDVSYTGATQITCIAVCDFSTMKVRESKYTISKPAMPHIEGIQGYREVPSLIETYHKLELEPDILIIDGNGILHQRLFGVASHMGLLLDKPSIGVAKDLACGELRGGSVYMDKEILGKMLETREKANPIYISPGHRISLKTAVEIVTSCLREHKMPEPLHQAHKIAVKIRHKLSES